ncbi:transposase Tn3 family protein (plasmid) [Sphingopyxis sp. EG6]|nr:transposase Tn3 family protein [Sphingopyxis sp. EG6]
MARRKHELLTETEREQLIGIPRDGSVANMGHGRAASPSWGIRQHWRNAY